MAERRSIVQPIRRVAAVATGRALLAGLRLARRGGTALPGLVAQTLDPHIIGELAADLPRGVTIVTGTNGKTTTTRLLGAICTSAGLRLLSNRSGSNLLRGLASTLIEQADMPVGTLRRRYDMGLLEVDEATIPGAVGQFQPRVLLMNNIFRDQLDRYGEVDTVKRRWRETVGTLGAATTLVLNGDDPSVAYMAHAIRLSDPPRIVSFGLNDPAQGLGALPHAVDAAKCQRCGAELHYEAIYSSHLGDWRCPNCGLSRPKLDVYATDIIANGADGTAFTLHAPAFLPEPACLEVGIPGLYNVYNAVGAAAAALAGLGVDVAAVRKGLGDTHAAFGRLERVRVPGAAGEVDKELLLALVKNPVGFNEVVRMLGALPQARPGAPGLALLIIINDLIADGRDVSWLWDVDFERLIDAHGAEGAQTQADAELSAAPNTIRVAWAMTSGSRATDMANRLKYAGLAPQHIIYEEDIAHALRTALDRLPPGETLVVTPTYTAMLALRGVLQKMGLVAPFWEE